MINDGPVIIEWFKVYLTWCVTVLVNQVESSYRFMYWLSGIWSTYLHLYRILFILPLPQLPPYNNIENSNKLKKILQHMPLSLQVKNLFDDLQKFYHIVRVRRAFVIVEDFIMWSNRVDALDQNNQRNILRFIINFTFHPHIFVN